ncbi:MBOAT family O-acyltransferase [Actomonas aquatica]|uniref:MBOAT family O-acyltransferase n=1 Tax=Actomonas aquatica TaxID=2866162 RepID=A0ABZ1CD74_9BACT|nr:MBOAT family O-acyltransferase [Opitutus sp. WL0086]WRQ89541.1 MBOAT family O-acyltransferase [Opitutus sp. WL0086]
MLRRSLGAESFATFWVYWNPIWSYYLGRGVFRPLHRVLPESLALALTFLVSGALHDLAVSLLKWRVVFFFGPWFLLMGLLVVISKVAGLSYGSVPFAGRVALNLTFIVATFALTEAVL